MGKNCFKAFKRVTKIHFGNAEGIRYTVWIPQPHAFQTSPELSEYMLVVCGSFCNKMQWVMLRGFALYLLQMGTRVITKNCWCKLCKSGSMFVPKQHISHLQMWLREHIQLGAMTAAHVAVYAVCLWVGSAGCFSCSVPAVQQSSWPAGAFTKVENCLTHVCGSCTSAFWGGIDKLLQGEIVLKPVGWAPYPLWCLVGIHQVG